MNILLVCSKLFYFKPSFKTFMIKPLPHLRDRARFTGSELTQKPKRCDLVVCI